MIEPAADGVVVTVHVIPRAAKSMLAGTRDGALLVRLNAPPVDGAANDELLHLLASVLGIARSRLSILSGQHQRRKRVLISGMGLQAALDALVPK
jgi:uncharacterized protein (TIGR00251 family)